jgi:hypothetical protein
VLHFEISSSGNASESLEREGLCFLDLLAIELSASSLFPELAARDSGETIASD